ncbi:MAG TPA: hypothetical protein VFG83_18395 [Kofleriaceae bacterium]|nr:hypothetical protein [Kofleriaceae bacterium]
MFVARDVRPHPRVARQALFADRQEIARLAKALPPLPRFRDDYHGAICILDWDHRLPSEQVTLRIFAYYSAGAMAVGEQAYDDRLEEIGRRDKFPEFDVPDFDCLIADEAYEIELSLDGEIGKCRLTSSWRRNINAAEIRRAIDLTTRSGEFHKRKAAGPPIAGGELEVVSWTPPCESGCDGWTLDVWYLTAFDGRIGSGLSFLLDMDTEKVVKVRDFAIRTG